MARRALLVVVLAVLTVSILLSYFFVPTQVYDHLQISKSSKTSEDAAEPQPASFHVLITANMASANLCRLMLSASILGYPSPVILGWDAGRDTNPVAAVHEYLSDLPETNADDVVILVDSDSAWFQLRPQTLLDRFFDINKRATASNRKQLGWSADSAGVRQEIIFATRDDCVTGDMNDPSCYATPQPASYEDVYGQRDDGLVPAKQSFNAAAHQPQYLDPSIAIGTLGAMTKLFGHALDMSKTEKTDMHTLLGKIHGQQALSRQLLRGNLRSAVDQLRRNAKGRAPDSNTVLQHLKDVKAHVGVDGNKDLQFGIGLDFGSGVAHLARSDTSSVNWVVADNDAHKRKMNEAREAVEPKLPEKSLLPVDIADTLPPFWTATVEELPRWKKWQEIPLLTNITRGVVPVAIHPDSKQAPDWSQMWFHKDARTLLDAYIYAPVTPVALSGPDASHMTEYWPKELWKGGARNGLASVGSGHGWLRIDHICSSYHEDMFGDGLGEWRLPENH